MSATVVHPAPAAVRAMMEAAPLAHLLHVLNGDGEETRVVGGAIRNALLGRTLVEHDLATTATPDVVVARAGAAGLRTVPTGIEHGTVTVMIGRTGFEVTSLREDVETDGRHARVRFGRDFARDAARRDFTINAFSLDRDGRIFDYVGGFADLAAGRVRFIGDPDRRIREDYLRSLRFLRFTADYAAGALDPAGLLAAMRGRDGLARLSRERVAAEIFKLVVARRADAVVAEACEAGLLGPLLALAPDPARFARLCRAEPTGDAALRLAALCVRLPEDVETLRDRLRLSNKDARRLAEAAAAGLLLHGLAAAPGPHRLREMLFRHGRQTARDALALARLEAREGPDWTAAAAFLRDTPEPHLPFSGADLQARGIGPGRAIGQMLKILQSRWIAAGFPQEPHDIARLLESVAVEE